MRKRQRMVARIVVQLPPLSSAGSLPWLRASLALLMLSTLACTSGGMISEPARVAPDALLAGTSLGVAADSVEVTQVRDVLGVSAEMKAFLDARVDRTASPLVKRRQLLDAVIDSGELEVEYDTTTHTAADTFRTRRGNCLSYAIMVVAMAREVGLASGFQEVDVPPDWTLGAETVRLNRHVNVYLDLGGNNVQVVDFNVSDFRTRYRMWKIPDGLALAHYYNNLGVDAMQSGDAASALASFRRAIAHSDRYSPAWTHIGILYTRHGLLEHAEAAHLQALLSDPRNLVAMSNLADVYAQSGDEQRASHYRRRVAQHRSQNPYHRYQLAQRAYAAHRYDEAIEHLEFAIRRRPEEHRFHLLLGLAHYGKGDLRAARRAIGTAREIVSTPSLRDDYTSKIANLLRLERN
jgi:Flp pilus assembly protein TadD